MFWFGQTLAMDHDLNNPDLWKLAQSMKLKLASTPLEQIVTCLDELSAYLEVHNCFESEVVDAIKKETLLSVEDIKQTLHLLPKLLKKESLNKRLRAEFINPQVLDRFCKLPGADQLTRAIPHGIILHVTAGNVFLSSIDSLIMGLVTKNISLLKVSQKNTFFPLWFAHKFYEFDKKRILSDKFAVLHWRGGNEEIEKSLKGRVNAIIAWGGEEMVASYKKDLPLNVKLIDFGPKISFQVISSKALQNANLEVVTRKICDDIYSWGQGACSSPQNLFLEESIDSSAFFKILDQTMSQTAPHRSMSEDEATEILKEEYRGLYSELMSEGLLYKGADYLIHHEKNNILRPSPLHTSLIVKSFKSYDDLALMLEPFSYYLQSCSYLLDQSEKENYLHSLSMSGVKRFAPLGTITLGMDGAPHDGRFVLRELVHFVGDETRSVDYGKYAEKIRHSQDLKDAFESHPHPPGYIFSSGGTTGSPKFTHYSYEEFDYMTDMLEIGLRAQGLKSAMVVANLFVAGNLWSSFMAIEKALEKIGTIQLPIGAQTSLDNILMYLEKFKPQVVMGIPSFLTALAEKNVEEKLGLTFDYIFYAGESLSSTKESFLHKIFNTKKISSAGYASVDAGVIGYQCSFSKPGEHHVFKNFVELEIINHEGVVTSHTRTSMPIVKYATGDQMRWIDEACLCGRADPRFMLLGRVDNLIMIWGCRLQVSDIEKSLSELNLDILNFQLELSEKLQNAQLREVLTIHVESPGQTFNQENLLKRIYENSRDLKDTISFGDFKSRVELVIHPLNSIARNPRTGKISLVRDLRHS